ncbi:hypothetical protein Ancab_023085 [Ancistrocladus abbreviatus]
MEGRLYDAALEGKVAVLLNLLNEDPLILDRCCISEGRFATSALHIAAERGHLEFSLQILNRKPELAEQLDSNKSSPLHLSSAKGRVEIVKALIIVSPDMCLARDLYGRNPFHLAAMKGQLDVLEELARALPQAGRERVNRNETVLHLCVKHDRLEALKLIVNSKIGDGEMLNARDDDGNSILHKAVADKQLELSVMENAKRWAKWLVEIKSWSGTQVCSVRAVWLRCVGVLLQVWDAPLFAKLASLWDNFIRVDDYTWKKRSFEMARVLVLMPETGPIKDSVQVKINEHICSIKVVERATAMLVSDVVGLLETCGLNPPSKPEEACGLASQKSDNLNMLKKSKRRASSKRKSYRMRGEASVGLSAAGGVSTAGDEDGTLVPAISTE